MNTRTTRNVLTSAVIALPLVVTSTLAGCSRDPELVDKTTPSVSAATPDNSTAATPSASGSTTATPTPSSTPTTSTTAEIQLPDEVKGWTKVEQTAEKGWTVAGYTNARGEVVEVRATQGTDVDGMGELRKVVGAKTYTESGMSCGQNPSGKKTSACMRPSGHRTVLITSVVLETEEIASLMPHVLEAIGE